MEKVKTAKSILPAVNLLNNEPRKDGTHNTLLALLLAGKDNCCLQEVKPAQPATPPQQPNMFDNDETLKQQEEQARAEKEKRDKEEKERKEKERKEKERKEKEKKEKKSGGWFGLGKAFDRFSSEIFSDDDMK